MSANQNGKAQYLAWGGVVVALVTGGIWLGNLYTTQTIHVSKAAHDSAQQLISANTQTNAVLAASMKHLRSDMKRIEMKLDKVLARQARSDRN